MKRIEAIFYKTNSGNEPVRDWLVSDLGKRDRQTVGMNLKDTEYGWPVGMPLCRRITSEKGLWEVRSNISGGRIARVLFCIYDGKMILLHGFIKKTQKTPKKEIDLAVKRMKEGD